MENLFTSTTLTTTGTSTLNKLFYDDDVSQLKYWIGATLQETKVFFLPMPSFVGR